MRRNLLKYSVQKNPPNPHDAHKDFAFACILGRLVFVEPRYPFFLTPKIFLSNLSILSLIFDWLYVLLDVNKFHILNQFSVFIHSNPSASVNPRTGPRALDRPRHSLPMRRGDSSTPDAPLVHSLQPVANFLVDNWWIGSHLIFEKHNGATWHIDGHTVNHGHRTVFCLV